MEEQPNILNTNKPAVQPEEANLPLKKPRRKLFVILGIILLAIIAGGAATYYLMSENKSVPVGDRQSALYQSSAEQNAKFYYTSNTDGSNKVVVYDPASDTKETLAELNLDNDRFINTSVAGTNQNVQIAAKGQKIFYASVVSKPGFIEGGEGEPPRDRELISIFEDGQETTLLDIKVNGDDFRTGVSIEDWVVSPDGSVVYYLVATPNKGDPELHMITVSDKKDTLIKAGLLVEQTTSTPLHVMPDGTLLLYAFVPGYKLDEHKVVNGQYSTKSLGEMGCNCMLEWPQALSPDGKKLLLGEQSSGSNPSDFTYYVFDIATEGIAAISNPLTNLSWYSSYWSPDSTHVVHGISNFGEAADFKPKIEIVSTSNKTTQTLVGEGKQSSPAGWSNGGRYMVFTEGKKFKFYDFYTESVLDNSIETDVDFGGSDQSWGWLAQ